MIILPISQTNNDDELAKTKRKLEIAVKGLKDLKTHAEFIGGTAVKYSHAYQLVSKCLKDLGVE